MAGLSKAGEEAQERLHRMRRMIADAQEKAGMKRAVALLERPKDGLTIIEYAKLMGIPLSTATVQMGKLLDNGAVKEYLVMLPTANGHIKAQRVFVFGQDGERQKGQDRRNARRNGSSKSGGRR